MRTALYVRVSTEDQAREGYSIEAQKRRLAAFVESQGWTIADFYVDAGFSAKDLNRPQMKRMLEDMENRLFDVILVYKLDRLTRSASDCDQLIKRFEAHNVAFQSCTESFETRTATGRLFIRLIADIAQWERENIGERVRFGMEQKVREGKKPNGAFPFGYDKQGNIIPEEAEIVRLVRHMYMKEDMGFKTIAMRLIDQGITRRGSTWRASTVATTLENTFYAGIIQFGSVMENGKYATHKKELRKDVIHHKGIYEAIFTEEEFYEHLRRIRRRSDSGYSRKLDYYFTGLLRCARCGSSMFGRMTTSRKDKEGNIISTPYYICSTRKENSTCKMPTFQQKHIEHMVMEYISSVNVDKVLTTAEKKKAENQNAAREKMIQKLKRDLESVQARVKKWQYMFIEELVTADDLRSRLNVEYETEAALLKSLEEAREQVKESEEIKYKLDTFVQAWEDADAMEKKELLNEIFDEIRVFSDMENPRGFRNGNFFPARIELKYR